MSYLQGNKIKQNFFIIIFKFKIKYLSLIVIFKININKN
jgi:hypothetical protein